MTLMDGTKVTFSELHATKQFREQFITSFNEPVDSILLCSPFFDKLPAPFENILEFCALMQRRGAETIQIVTRPPTGRDNSLDQSVAKLLNEMGVRIFVRTKPYFHAKFYHIEYTTGRFKTFIGSANFTTGGFERNYELMAELQGSGNETACHREIARMRDVGALSYEAWVTKGLPAGNVETV